MTLVEAKLNANCIVESVNIADEKTKIRLLELGLVKGSRVVVKKISILKKTLLVALNGACFTLKDELAKGVNIKYA